MKISDRDEVVPVRKTISDEMLVRYNGMLTSVFELLADSRDQVAAVNGYIDALKDYWLAETDLQQSLGGRLPPIQDLESPKTSCRVCLSRFIESRGRVPQAVGSAFR